MSGIEFLASVAGLATVAFDISRTIFDLLQTFKGLPQAIQELAHSTKALGGLLDQIDEKARKETANTPFGQAVRQRSFRATIAGCDRDLGRLKIVLFKLTKEDSSAFLVRVRYTFKWIYLENQVESVKKSLETHKSLLSIFLSLSIDDKISEVHGSTIRISGQISDVEQDTGRILHLLEVALTGASRVEQETQNTLRDTEKELADSPLTGEVHPSRAGLAVDAESAYESIPEVEVDPQVDEPLGKESVIQELISVREPGSDTPSITVLAPVVNVEHPMADKSKVGEPPSEAESIVQASPEAHLNYNQAAKDRHSVDYSVGVDEKSADKGKPVPLDNKVSEASYISGDPPEAVHAKVVISKASIPPGPPPAIIQEEASVEKAFSPEKEMDRLEEETQTMVVNQPPARIQTPELVKALVTASRFGFSDTAALLLDTGVDLNAHDEDTTALCEAVYWNHAGVAGLLLERGANPDLPNRQAGLPLTIAARRSNAAMVRLLLQYGAKANLPGILAQSVLGLDGEITAALCEAGANVNDVSGDTTPLIQVIYWGKMEALKVLLEYGVDPTLQGKSLSSPIVVAAQRNQTEMMNMLLKYGRKSS